MFSRDSEELHPSDEIENTEKKGKIFDQVKDHTEEDEIEADASVTYYVMEDGETHVDVYIKDNEDRTVDNFSNMISGIGSDKFQLETIQIIKQGFMDMGRHDLFLKFLNKVILIDSFTSINESTEGKRKGNDPCIKPSDMI